MADKSRYCASQDQIKGLRIKSTREQLSTQCEKALEYPRTLIHNSTYPHSLDLYLDRLNEYEDRLFQGEYNAVLDFSDLDSNGSTSRVFTVMEDGLTSPL